MMEIKNIVPESIPQFEEQLQLDNVKYLTLCTEEGIVAYLAGVEGVSDNQINVSYLFYEAGDFNEPVAKQMYDLFMQHNISEEIKFTPNSDEEKKFIQKL